MWGWIVRFSLATLFFVLQTGLAAAQAFATFDLASEPVLNDPHDLEFGPDGLLYVADRFNGDIVVMDPETLLVMERIGGGTLIGVHDVSFSENNVLFAAVTGLNAVFSFVKQGETWVADQAISGASRTEGVLAHPNGLVYVMASGTGELVAFNNGDAVRGIRGFNGAHDVTLANEGTIWVADTFRGQLVQLSEDLEFIGALNGPKFGMLGPRYLKVDEFGRLIVADQDSHRILMIDPKSGQLLGTLGDGEPGLGPNKFDDPEGVAIDGSRYYFADSDNNRIVRYVVLIN